MHFPFHYFLQFTSLELAFLNRSHLICLHFFYHNPISFYQFYISHLLSIFMYRDDFVLSIFIANIFLFHFVLHRSHYFLFFPSFITGSFFFSSYFLILLMVAIFISTLFLSHLFSFFIYFKFAIFYL